MKKLYILVALVLSSYVYSSASHSSGGQLTYKCLGGNTYEITVTFFRDCVGATTPGGCNVTFNATCSSVQSSSCGNLMNPYFAYSSPSHQFCTQDSFVTAPKVVEIMPTCPGQLTTCNGGTLPGYQKWTYSKIITLPFQANDWTFAYGTASRNKAINTINTPQFTQFVVKSTLNNIAGPANSSPSFGTPNVYYLCAGQSYCFYQGPSEMDGDSLRYSLAQPTDGYNAGQYAAYLTGYSYTSPFGASSPITLDASTGTICVTPTTQLVTIMAVLVSEYRNGQLVGTVYRDYEFVVGACNNTAPSLTGVNGAAYAITSDTASVCAGTQLCFNVNGSDANTSDLLTLSWDTSITNATFTVTNNNTKTPVGQFCWTPTLSNVRKAPYTFIVAVHDNACPIEGIKYYPFFVYVKTCGSVVLPPVAHLSSSDSTICENDCVNFTDLSTNNPTSWTWRFPGSYTPLRTDQNPLSVCYPTSGSYNVTLIATNSGGTDSITFTNFITVVSAPPTPSLTLSNDTLYCSFHSSYVSYQWYDSSSMINGATLPYYKVTHSGNFNVKVTNANGCSISVGINIILGLQSLAMQQLQLSISPNPAQDNITVYGLPDSWQNSVVFADIYNYIGMKLFHSPSQIKNPQSGMQVHIPGLSSGVYFIRIENGNQKAIGRFIRE